MKLDLNATEGNLVQLHDALVVPPPGGGNMRARPSGVLDQKGSFVEQSISWNSSEIAVNSKPAMPETSAIVELRGRHIFGGIFYGHFGHFIVDSLSRIWALDAVDGPVDGLIFTPKQERVSDRFIAMYKELLAGLGINVEIRIAHRPTRVEDLIVPRQGFGMNDLAEGSDAFRRFINDHAGRDVIPAGGDKLYISRSRLPPFRGSILGEARLESYLNDEGYEIFHPQEAAQLEQIARYKGARQIIAVDCSPLHLLGYVGNADQNVAILTRRSLDISRYLIRQLTRFKGMTANEINVLINDWIAQPGSRPCRSSFGEVDFPQLHSALLSLGLINNPTPWPASTIAERDSELDRLGQIHKTTFETV